MVVSFLRTVFQKMGVGGYKVRIYIENTIFKVFTCHIIFTPPKKNAIYITKTIFFHAKTEKKDCILFHGEGEGKVWYYLRIIIIIIIFGGGD